MKGKLIRSIFWALVGVFVVSVGIMVSAPLLLPTLQRVYMGFLFSSGALFLSLGITFLVLTIKGKTKGISRKFQLLIGASAVGIPISAILHNAIYALFILWQGEGFWERIGLGDEPVFFIIAIIVCPIGFLVGVVGSIVLTKKKSRQQSVA
ncbi:hypothetical protein ES703_109095 [subsurface metagenome]